MSDQQSSHAQINAFEEAYSYDAAYLHELIDRSPKAFTAFSAAQPMLTFRDQLPADAYFTAAITVMQAEDCSSCLELNLKMAVESGVDRETLMAVLEAPNDLTEPLQDIYQHTQDVLHCQMPDEDCAKRIELHYGPTALAELALCIASMRVYPTLKRAMLKSNHCSVSAVSF